MPELDHFNRFLASLPAALLPFAALGLAIALGLGLHSLLVWIVRRFELAPDGFPARALKRTKSPTRLAFATAGLIAALSLVELPGQIEGRLQHLAAVLFIILLGWIASSLIGLATEVILARYRLEDEDNLHARRSITQLRILTRTAQIVIVIVTISAVLLTFEGIQQYGVSLLASAGAAGLILGLAAQPVLANLIAGIQIALTQPIRIDDVVIVENEWGWIEDIGASFVTIRLWDWRRLIVPLKYFIEQPFQNWTRESSAIIGEVRWHLDYTVPVERVREKLTELVSASPRWDKRVVNLQVVDATESGIVLRALMSARNSPIAWDLRCEVREAMIAWLQAEYPDALPRWRGELHTSPAAAPPPPPS